MQTVNFKCGHCGNLMAVGTDFLGQQVRCPHCQQVVVAPPPAQTTSPFAPPPPMLPSPVPLMLPPEPAPRPPEPMFKPLDNTDHEDIFAAPSSSDVFGESSPRLEMPRDPLPPSPAAFGNGETVLHVPDMRLTEAAPSAPAPVLSPAGGDSNGQTVAFPGAAALEMPPGPAPDTDQETGPVLGTGRVRRPDSQGGAWFIPLVFIPLVLYAILATAVAGYLYFQVQQRQPGLFDQMPDLEGDNPGVRKVNGAVIRYKALADGKRLPGFKASTVTRPLPEYLLTNLGSKLTIGDLEITPERVERAKVFMADENIPKAEDCQYESLVLHLRLRNISTDNIFTPLDNFFDRSWAQGQGAPPFTLLEAGHKVCYGGPAAWYPKTRRRADGTVERRQWLAGLNGRPWSELGTYGRKNRDPEGLKPGAEIKTIVATNGLDEQTALHLFGGDEDGKKAQPYRGQLLWRVQVRRGLVSWRGKEVPATTVFGVRFSDADYRKAG